MASSFWISQAIYVAAKLGIADLLKNGPLKVSDIAAIVGTDVLPTFRLMRSLASLGIFAQTKNGYFSLLPLGENLRADISGSLKAIIITLGEIHYQACGALLHAVQTGSPAFDQVFGAGFFEYLDQNTEGSWRTQLLLLMISAASFPLWMWEEATADSWRHSLRSTPRSTVRFSTLPRRSSEPPEPHAKRRVAVRMKPAISSLPFQEVGICTSSVVWCTIGTINVPWLS
jgi:hypothetical protein